MATPTIVQHVVGPPQDSVPSSGATATFTLGLANPSTSGNFLLLILIGNNGQTISSVTDNKSQTWTAGSSITTGTNLNGFIYYFPNTAAGVTTLTITWNASGPTFTQYAVSEWFNIAASSPIRLTWTNEGTTATTSWAAGSATQTPTSGDLIYQAAYSGSQPYNSSTVFTAGSGFNLEAADLTGGFVAQSQISNGTAINPTVTAGRSVAYESFAVALIPAAQGSQNSNAFRVARIQAMNPDAAFNTPLTYQFPCDGNLQALLMTGITEATSATSSGNAFTQTPSSPQSNGVGGAVATFYSSNASSPGRTNNGTVTWAANPTSGRLLWFVDIVGSGVFDTDVGTTGNQTVAGNLTDHSLTPSGTDVIIDIFNHNSGSDTGITSPTGGTFVPPYLGQDGTSGSDWAQDSGLVSVISSSAVTFTYTRSATAAGLWSAIAIAFKPSGASPFVPPPDFVNPLPFSRAQVIDVANMRALYYPISPPILMGQNLL